MRSLPNECGSERQRGVVVLIAKVRFMAKCTEPECNYACTSEDEGGAISRAMHHINGDIGADNPRPFLLHVVAIQKIVSAE